ncbi:MAG TPA: DUF4097 family beta strand repeat-containing protein [Candidatus Acidoferrales bacterium]|nr:DUF4097 family beta strand repeat-containing protein [Candidatus Acidoferrales bacterium]
MKRLTVPFWCVAGALALFVGPLFVGLVAVPAHADDWSKTYQLTGRPNLRVITNDGRVDLYQSAGNAIEAHVTTNGWPIAKPGSDNGVRITETQSGNDITLQVRVPSFHFSFGWNNRSVRIELHVPKEADLDVQTGDGGVTSQAFHGQLRISTGDGNIDADGLTGHVRLHSGDGHIRADGLDGDLDADSGDGRIDVNGRFDSLRLQSGDGSVTAEARSGSKMGGDWSLRSGDGSVTLRLADGLNADLDAHTGDGHITLDFPVTMQGDLSRSTVRGKIGSGGPPLVVHTGDGSIHISKI